MSTLNINKNQQNHLCPDWATFVPEDVYHRKALAGQAISSTMLREFRKSPAQYFARITGRIFEKNCTAFRVGRAVHKLLLEGDHAYRAAFSVGGPNNDRTGRPFGADTKAFREWVAGAGLDPARVVTPSEALAVERMRRAVHRHKDAASLLARGWPERTAEAELCGLPCQARMDWLTPDGTLVDVKTTRCMDEFENDARRHGYLHQFAFYADVAVAAGAGRLSVAAVVVEKFEPHRVGVWTFPESVLAPYAAQNAETLARLKRCRETGIWPSGFEEKRAFPAPALQIPAAWLN